MTVEELEKATGWKLIATEEAKAKEVKGAFCGDLLSWVMGNSHPDQVWLTVQSHLNVVAVAVLREFSGIVFVQGVNPPQETIDKALEEDLAILQTDLTAYEACARLYDLGI
ncbi:MAG: hypothetical protein PUF50_03270 [Erysipelotrichaceae bacterium]|nr:hypothetical protein [Erysipelotrichaceae bacterium]